MKHRAFSVWESLIIFILLGAESCYFLLLPFTVEYSGYGLLGGYLLLLLVYPMSKKQKTNISKRETYLTIFFRWLVLNLATIALILNQGEIISKRDILFRFLLLAGIGGFSLYLLLFIERLHLKFKRKGEIKSLVIYGKADEAVCKNIDKRSEKGFKFHDSAFCYFISAEERQDKLEKLLLQYDRAYILDIPAQRRNELLKLCYKTEKPVYCISKLSDIMIQGGYTVKDEDKAFFCCEKYRLDKSEEFVKRCFDLLGSCLALVILSPLFLIIALCIKLEDGGSVIYKQIRCTKDNKEFWIYKFRSMVVDAEPEGAMLAEESDRRITKVGSILRNTKLDELPQLVNILRGDMSFVGPRPERPELISRIVDEVPEFSFRTYVKAGLTGYAQVQGNYSTLPLDKLKWDLMYINQYSFFLDLKIMFMTPFVIFMKNNREDK